MWIHFLPGEKGIHGRLPVSNMPKHIHISDEISELKKCILEPTLKPKEVSKGAPGETNKKIYFLRGRGGEGVPFHLIKSNQDNNNGN